MSAYTGCIVRYCGCWKQDSRMTELSRPSLFGDGTLQVEEMQWE